MLTLPLGSALQRDIEDALYRAVEGGEPMNRLALNKIIAQIERWCLHRHGFTPRVTASMSTGAHEIQLRVEVPRDAPSVVLSATNPFFPIHP